MYAIIKTGGKQLKVEAGQTIYVEKSEENLDIGELENQAIDTMEIIEIA